MPIGTHPQRFPSKLLLIVLVILYSSLFSFPHLCLTFFFTNPSLELSIVGTYMFSPPCFLCPKKSSYEDQKHLPKAEQKDYSYRDFCSNRLLCRPPFFNRKGLAVLRISQPRPSTFFITPLLFMEGCGLYGHLAKLKSPW